jgi:hypothetical protein
MEVIQMVEKIKPVEKVDDLTPVQRLAKIDADRKELIDSIKAEALQKANEAVQELNALGFHFVLSEEGDKNGSKKGEPSPDADCPICKFRTLKPHDARAHRSQTVKAPFTLDELHQKGMIKI